MQKKSIAIVTSTRAEYGLLRGVIKGMMCHKNIETRLIVTGTHLDERFGHTIDEIKRDGVQISAEIPILKYGTSTNFDTVMTMAHTIEQFANYFSKNKPDAVMVLGDRYEILAVSLAAAGLLIPVIHISGGDVTHGAADDYYRHCITKAARLHFPSCAEYAGRVIRLGECPKSVHNVGGLGDENIRKLKLMDRQELSESIKFDVNKQYFLVTYHPQTAGDINNPSEKFKTLLSVLAKFDVGCIFTKANADAGGAQINALIDKACEQNGSYIAFDSMGVLRYLSAMKYCSAVVGNSSSGVVETPTMGVPCVNIGNRQSGRIICSNVICCNDDEHSIEHSIKTALSSDFKAKAAKTVSPYNGGDTAEKIVDITCDFLENFDELSVKVFYDG